MSGDRMGLGPNEKQPKNLKCRQDHHDICSRGSGALPVLFLKMQVGYHLASLLLRKDNSRSHSNLHYTVAKFACSCEISTSQICLWTCAYHTQHSSIILLFIHYIKVQVLELHDLLHNYEFATPLIYLLLSTKQVGKQQQQHQWRKACISPSRF